MGDLNERLAGLSPEKRVLLLEKLGERGAELPDEEAVTPSPDRSDYPLSFMQERLWFLSRTAYPVPFGSVPITLRLRGELRPDRLKRAVRRVVRRNEVLRTRFPADEGEVRQVVEPAATAAVTSLRSYDLTDRPLDRARRDALVSAVERADTAFEFWRRPPFRVHHWRVGGDEHLLLVDIHNLLMDGRSADLLLGELADAYGTDRTDSPRAPVDGDGGSAADRPQYGDFAAWQRERWQDPAETAAAAHWRERLEGATSDVDPGFDAERPSRPSYRGHVVPLRIPAGITGELRNLAEEREGTLFMAVLAGLQALLARRAGIDDPTVLAPVSSRPRPEVEELVGNFTSDLPLRGDLAGDPSFGELLDRVRSDTLEDLDHQDVPVLRLLRRDREESASGRDADPRPQFMLVFRSRDPADSFDLPGVDVERVAAKPGAAPVDLTLDLHPSDGGLEGTITGASDLLAPRTTRGLGRELRDLCAALVESPGRPISELEPASDAPGAGLGSRPFGNGGEDAAERDRRPDLPPGRPGHRTAARGAPAEEDERSRAGRVLASHPAVESCRVRRGRRADGEPYLAAFWVRRPARPPGGVPTGRLRRFLGERLPARMQPAFLVEVGAEGRLSDPPELWGLPTHDPDGGGADGRAGRTPETADERAVAGVWSSVLGVDAVRAGDRFYDLGGTSLQAMEAIPALENALGREVSPAELLLETVEQIAARPGDGDGGAGTDALAAEGSSGPPAEGPSAGGGSGSRAFATRFGAGSTPLFGLYHPARRPERGEPVVVCPDFGSDVIPEEGTARRAASGLSGAGHPVFRFDYRGTGDSAGSTADLDLHAWEEDAWDAAREARVLAGAERVTLLARGLGSIPALRLASRSPAVSRVVLRDPVADGHTLLRSRAREDGDGGGDSSPVAAESRGPERTLEMGGVPVPHEFARQVARFDVSEVDLSGLRVLILHPGPGGEEPEDAAAVRGSGRIAGRGVEHVRPDEDGGPGAFSGRSEAEAVARWLDADA